MNKLIDREMTKEEIRNVKCFDDLMFRKSKYSTDKFTTRALTASFENGNRISCIEEREEPSHLTEGWHYWNCIVSIVTDKETNKVKTEHQQMGEYCIGSDDKDELLRIFILNRDYTYTTEIIHTLIKTSKQKEAV